MNILSEEQCGFRNHQSYEMALNVVLEDWEEDANKNKCNWRFS